MMHGGWGWGGFMPMFGGGPWPTIILLIAAVFVFVRLSRRDGDASEDRILARRYAAGEITREQFLQMKQDLHAH